LKAEGSESDRVKIKRYSANTSYKSTYLTKSLSWQQISKRHSGAHSDTVLHG